MSVAAATAWRRAQLSSWAVRGDPLAILLLVALTCIASSRLLVVNTVVGQDTITQFYPWYSHLGERLRSGDIPAWSPHQFSGAPFAADPQSGWMYLRDPGRLRARAR